MTKHFERPTEDFWICSLKSSLEIVSRHTNAGFHELPECVVRIHEFILFDFLFEKGLITERLAISSETLHPDTSLHNRHLTDKGYYFLQKFLPRWQARLYKHTTEAKERAFLEKWHAQFESQRAQQGAPLDVPAAARPGRE